MIADRTCLYKRAWAGLPLRGIKSRICYSSPGLFNCWIGHNYPVPQWARWPNQNGVIHTIFIGDKLCWLFCKQLILLPDNSSVSFWTASQHFISDGSATFHFIWDSYWNGCNLYGYIITGCFSNSLRHVVLYFNWHTITQYITQYITQ